MKRKAARLTTPTPSSKTVSVRLSVGGIQVIVAAMRNAMYSQGYPGKPPQTPIQVSDLLLLGEDAIALAQLDGTAFVPPTGAPLVQAKRLRPRRRMK